MFFRCLIVTLIGSLLCCCALRAADNQRTRLPLPPGLTILEAQRIALESNADIRVAQLQVDAAIAQLRTAREFPNPILGLSVAKINTDRRTNVTLAGNGFFDRSYDSIASLAHAVLRAPP